MPRRSASGSTSSPATSPWPRRRSRPERELAGRRDDARADRARASTSSRRCSRASTPRARGFPPRLTQLEAELRAHASAAGALDSAQAQLARCRGSPRRRARCRAARRRRSATPRPRTSRRSSALEQAAAAVTALLRRRLAGHAGELAAALVDGEACAVCGSTEHPPRPRPTDEPVTDDDLAAAERSKDARSRRPSVPLRAPRARRARRTRRPPREPAARACRPSTAAHAAAETAVRDGAPGRRRARPAHRRARATSSRPMSRCRSRARSARRRARRSTRERSPASPRRCRPRGAAVDAARGAFATVADRIADATRPP